MDHKFYLRYLAGVVINSDTVYDSDGETGRHPLGLLTRAWRCLHNNEITEAQRYNKVQAAAAACLSDPQSPTGSLISLSPPLARRWA